MEEIETTGEDVTPGTQYLAKSEVKDLVFKTPAKALKREDLIKVFAIVTRFSNAIDRRKRELRKFVDKLIDKEKLKVPDDESKLTVDSDGFKLVLVVKDKGEKVLDQEKVKALLDTKGKLDQFDKLFVQPPPPKPVFSEERFKALQTLGFFTEEEYDSCFVDPPPVKPTVTVEVTEELDDAIVQMILGNGDESGKGKRTLEG